MVINNIHLKDINQCFPYRELYLFYLEYFKISVIYKGKVQRIVSKYVVLLVHSLLLGLLANTGSWDQKLNKI